MLQNCLFAFIHAAILLFGECTFVETRKSDVEIIATDPLGYRLPVVQVEFYAPESGVLLQKVDSAKARVLYGEYRIRIHAGGAPPAWRLVNIDQETLLIRADFEISSLGCPNPPADIGGRIVGDGSKRELWVKAVPLRGVGGGEARVADTGHFLISGLNRSTYLLLVVDGETVVRQQVVKTFPIGPSGANKLVISLGKSSGLE
ncbi:MAG: hypothetical protein QM757_46515 [Paludibaculum sp.]